MENQTEKERAIGFIPDKLQLNFVSGDYHLLVIGINKYAHPSSYRNLDYPEIDTEKLAQELHKRYNFKQVRILQGKEATRAAILQNIESFESVNMRDNVIIFFAGHGDYRNPLDYITPYEPPLGYIVPHDAANNTKSGLISHTTLVEHLQSIPAKHVLVILDCCYGGLLLKERSGEKDINRETHGLEKKNSRKFISSGHIEKVPDRSVFMKILLETLKINQQDELPINTLYQKIIDEVEEKQLLPIPICSPIKKGGDDGGDMVLRLKDSENEEVKAANMVMKFRTQENYKNYLSKYKNGEHKREVIVAMQAEKKIEEDVWLQVKKNSSFEAISRFLDSFRDGFYFIEANETLIELEDKSKVFYLKAEKIIAKTDKILGKTKRIYGQKIENDILEKYQEAANYFDKAIQFNPSYFDAYISRIRVNKILQNYELILADYDKVLDIDFNLARILGILSERAFTKAKMGKLEEALNEIDTIIESYESSGGEDKRQNIYFKNRRDAIEFYATRASIKTDLKDYEGALKDYESILTLEPLLLGINETAINELKELIKNQNN
jgi:tetratricopeptide (TPR) repeat protein